MCPAGSVDFDLQMEATVKGQMSASSPLASAWVSANAGAGKTYVLKTRVLRLLLGGTAPDRILCLTFTKSAAAEMAARVFSELSVWATCDDADLSERLFNTLGRQASPEEAANARKLFARAIETPGGLKVLTIHAFCERLLQRFPLEAGVPPGFSILDDETSLELKRQAINTAIAEAVSDRASALGRALETMIAYAAEDGFDEVLARAIGERQWLDGVMRVELRFEDHLRVIDRHYRQALGVRQSGSVSDIEAEINALMSNAALKQAAVLLNEGSKRDQERAGQLLAASGAQVASERAKRLETVFLTAESKPRADQQFLTKAIREAHPDLADRLVKARDDCAGLVVERQGLVVVEATLALLIFADRVQQAYSVTKARRASLDFDDLILHSSWLLQGTSAAEWVLYKLDGGLDHILVDEAQDTSPMQWEIIGHLAREFFAGSGRQDIVRTLFAVGDEKQSIYSFQGADPKMFADAGRNFQELAELANCNWHNVPLTMSFRSVVPVLQAVDQIFSVTKRTPGLVTGANAVRHEALRIGHAGLVEVWPTVPYIESEQSDFWVPSDDGSAQSPVSALASQIADTIARWLRDGEMLESEGRPVQAGDILILVNKRKPFAAPMVAALKARGIPVAGADRIMLNEQVVVQDLLALADFLTLPEDDLALAIVLKSPLFGLDDDDLLKLAPARRGMLWSNLLGASKSSERYAAITDTLKRWRAQADIKPPFEFFAGLFDKDGMRARFLTRLGAEAIDPLDEFLNLAILFDDKAIPSLTGFVDFVRKARRELKRDMEQGRNEVRVMTVHGAKGLEAPIVFLPDTCSSPTPPRGRDLVRIGSLGTGEGAPPLFVWPVKGAGRLEAIAAARSETSMSEIEERNRLLYVALTRARDRLYIAGYEGKRGRAKGCWYDLILEGLGESLDQIEGADGQSVTRLSTAQSVPSETSRQQGALPPKPVPLPDWANRPAPPEPQLTIPLAPSRLAPFAFDETGDPIDPDPISADAPIERAGRSPLSMSRDQRLLRGTLTHALLEHLPTVPRDQWQQVAIAFVAVRGGGLAESVQHAIVRETLAVLEEPSFSRVFGPEARAEVGIVAEIPRDVGFEGPPLRITGQLDRLLVTDQEVLIVDFKSNRSPPRLPEDVNSAYLYQLAAYRLAVQKVYGDRPVRTALLWTDEPRLMPVPNDLLVSYEQRLRQLDRVRLDALAAGT